MSDLSYRFSNAEDPTSQYFFYPGVPFQITGFKYKILILPETDNWRFGINLSMEQNLIQSEDGAIFPRAQVFLDISRINEGNSDDYSYAISTYYKNHEGYEFLVNQEVFNFAPKIFDLEFELDESSEVLSWRYYINESIENTANVLLEMPSRYFQFFSFSEDTEHELSVTISVRDLYPTLDYQITTLPFQVGNIIFNWGDMLEYQSTHKNAMIVIPISNDGSLRGTFYNKIKDLDIPYPEKSLPGQITVHRTNSSIYPYVAYACSVDVDKSSSDIITQICQDIIDECNEVLSHVKRKVLNMPLLGTGAGKLDIITVADIYNKEFNGNYTTPTILVNVQNERDFIQIRNHFLGRHVFHNQDSFNKPLALLELEDAFSVELDSSSYTFNDDGDIIHLTLSDFQADDLNVLRQFPMLESLTISSSRIANFFSLLDLNLLTELNLLKCDVSELNFLSLLKLKTLTINSLPVSDFSFFYDIDSLQSLTINNCAFKDIECISRNSELHSLDLSRCEIVVIKSLNNFTNLLSLNLSSNLIVDISVLSNLKKLSTLLVNENRIHDISPIIRLKRLSYLRADSNPFINEINVILNQKENHLQTIKNYYSRQKENNKVRVALPAKVVLLGNHASGKSSLLNFIINGEIGLSPESTHIVRIEKFWSASEDMPEAIFFDFGGQDYYHGIYRAFLSSGSLYLLLWNSSNNNNRHRIDSRNTYTQDFSLAYWLSQKSYLENEKFEGNIDPLLIIQSMSDKDSRGSIQYHHKAHKVHNEFFVSLKADPNQFEDDFQAENSYALQHLKASIKRQINLAKTLTLEPLWYSNFIKYIVQQSKIDSYESKSVALDILPQYKKTGPNKLESLMEDLDQLHKRGLVLYYKSDIPDKVWLNPEALVRYIHDNVLNIKEIGKFNGIIPGEEMHLFEPEIVDLLCKQKVIFKHDLAETVEYIAPNFLPLVNRLDPDFDLFTFDLGRPYFILKFLNFLPFGIINQLICLFKNESDHTKKFWRNQLLFTFKNKSKIMIHVDFDRLEIKVHSFFRTDVSETDRTNIHKYLFFIILSTYWDMDMLDFDDYLLAMKGNLKKEDYEPDTPIYDKIDFYERIYEKQECRPIDLFISTDMTHFINYEELCSDDNNSQMINSRVMGADGNLTDKNVPIPIYGFQNFTQKTLKRIRKVVISYSKRDLKLVNKFKDYMVPLHQTGLIESPWYCTELIAGQEWNEEIRKRFSEADIIFFMISENLMSTKYVLENEIKDAIDRWDNHKSVKIVPILLEPYNFVRNEPYNLSRFSALPFTLQAITEFKNQKLAWHAISECMRIAIQKDIDPTSSGELTTELRTIFEKIVKEKFDLD